MLSTIVRELFNQRIDNYNFRNFSYFDMRNVNGEWGIRMKVLFWLESLIQNPIYID